MAARRHPAVTAFAVRTARLLVVALLIGIGIAEALRAIQVMLGAGLIDHPDLDAYLGAAQRLRDGLPLYPEYPGISQDADFLYRYAPWFAFAFIPMTFLPRDLVAVIWDVVLLAATFACVWPLMRARTMTSIALAMFLGGYLMKTTAFANVHALMLVPLVYGVDRRLGPLWIAIAASLKAFPVLLVVAYVGRREWARAAATLGLTAVLVAPMLAFDLTHYPTESAGAWLSLPAISPAVWLLVTALLAALTLRYARTRFGWLLAAVTMILASPRIHQPYLAGLVIGLQGRDMNLPSPATASRSPQRTESKATRSRRMAGCES